MESAAELQDVPETERMSLPIKMEIPETRDDHSEHNGSTEQEHVPEPSISEQLQTMKTTDAISVKTSGVKLSNLRSGVEEKSHLLSNTWSELYNLLGEYKAELFSREALGQKYESVNSMDTLKSELIEKDNEITQLRQQLEQVQDQCEQLQRHNEQCQIDLSVKDSLLKKYQDDLLQKEAALMTSSTKVSRLENRLRMLESRASQVGDTSLRRTIKPQLPRVPPRMLQRGGMVGGRTPIMGRTTPGLSFPIRRRPAQATSTPIRRSIPNVSMPETSTASSVKPDPVICIEVDDDEELREVASVSQQPLSALEQSEQFADESYQTNLAKTEATDIDSLPGTSGEYSHDDQQQELDANQSLMMEQDTEYAGHQAEGNSSVQPEAWPVGLIEQPPMQSRMPQQQQHGPPSNKIQAEPFTVSLPPRGQQPVFVTPLKLRRSPKYTRKQQQQQQLEQHQQRVDSNATPTTQSGSDESPTKRKQYEYNRDLRDEIARLAIQVGDRTAARHFSEKLGHTIHYWTVYNFKKSFLRRMNNASNIGGLDAPRPRGRRKKTDTSPTMVSRVEPQPSLGLPHHPQSSTDSADHGLQRTELLQNPIVLNLRMTSSEAESSRRKQASPVRMPVYNEPSFDDYHDSDM